MDTASIRNCARILMRRGWPETSLLVEGGHEVVPDFDSIVGVLEYFFSHHGGQPDLAVTALGCRELPDRRIFVIVYRPEGWERDVQELYDCISLASGAFDMAARERFLRKVGAEFAPTEENLHLMRRFHDLCGRRARAYYFNLPPDEQKFLDRYLDIAARRRPPEKETEFYQNKIGHCLSAKVAEDLFRLAHLLGRDDIVEEEWERCRVLPPEQYRDELFLKFYAKCGDSDGCNRILDDLWRRKEPWALYRLVDRLRKGFPVDDRDEKLRFAEARLLAMGQRISGEWNREELRHILDLCESELPESLFVEPSPIPGPSFTA
jgi:hypothetical protein